MSHTIQISDETYKMLRALADEQGQTPEALVEGWAARQWHDRAGTRPQHQTFEEFFADLGMSEDEIRRATELAERDDADLSTRGGA